MSLVAFLEKNWMMALVFVVSGAMLVMPLVTRRLSKAKDVGNLEATVLINKKDAILVDVRETSEYENGRLPGAVHIPLSQLEARAAEIGKQASRPGISRSSALRLVAAPAWQSRQATPATW